MPVRTFFALDLDESIRDRLLAACKQLSAGDAKIRWVSRPQLHVTLKFIGDVADEQAADVFSLAEAAAGEVEPFEFDVRGVLCIPPHGNVLRMIWAAVADPSGRMGVLHDNLDDALAGMGLKEEQRGFKPHVTLARIKYCRNPDPIRRLGAPLANEDFGVQHAEELVAYSSALTPDGPIYTPLARFPLG